MDAAPLALSRHVVIGGLGIAVLLAVVPGWREDRLSVAWKAPHASAGPGAWPRVRAAPVWLDVDGDGDVELVAASAEINH